MLTRNEEKLLRALSKRKRRMEERCFLAEGVRLVEDLLGSALRVRFLVHLSTLEDTDRGTALLAAAEDRGIRTVAVDERDFGQLADTLNPQGVLAVAEIPEWSLDSLQLELRPSGVLLLDAVQDPGNFGTLVRTAEALGAAGVLLLPGTVDPWNGKAVRAAMGSSFRLPIVSTTWDEAEPRLRERSHAIFAADAGGEPLRTAAERFALVVGNEGSGVSGRTREVADAVVSIPLRGRAESLNVSAAAAILLHQLLS